MKKLFHIIYSLLIISSWVSCVPMETKIQQAIAETQTTEKTRNPIPTITPTIKVIPTITPTIFPTIRPESEYIIEVGVCPIGIDINSDPRVEKCSVLESQIKKDDIYQYIESIEVDINIRNMPVLIAYCAIYKPNGELVDFQLDSKSTGKISCKP